ncbi:MAG: Na(+)/H(+) antiporter subunit D [Thermodesulfobacteriota bacterium]|nr:Na(+)/H(+) antiporter subunit D [Thermodesulfobacteriota bacterium]
MTSSFLIPAFIFFIGALLLLVVSGKAKQILILVVPVIAFFYIALLSPDATLTIPFLQYHLNPLHVDKLSKVFGYIFCIAAFGSFLFALHIEGKLEHLSALVYVGSALGVVFAGDFFSLYIFWEFMAVASVMLIWSRRTKKALDAGYRYVLVHIVGGLVLLSGILVHVHNTGSLNIGRIQTHDIASWLILIGFMLNAAVPPLSAWLSDAYPEGTATGSVFLSAFTTKTAVYTMIRVFPGWEVLIWLGAFMTIYGIIYAIMENDSRKILAYSIINQVGFMVCGIGIGTAMAINGAAAHAFAHIIYKGLLWMAAGSVLYMTGKTKCTDLGGLYKTMPLTLICCCIAAASISAFPLTSGFTTKTMILQAATSQHLTIIYFMLEAASAGVFLHAGIKFPYFVFFAKDKGLRATDPKLNMQWAMIFFACLCIGIGVYPEPLYKILPYHVDYHAYTGMHVVRMLQLLFFSGLAFFVFLRLLKRTETITIDTDWIYRKGSRLVVFVVTGIAAGIARLCEYLFIQQLPRLLAAFAKRPIGIFVDAYRRAGGEKIRTSASEPELATTIPAGVSVLFAIGFLFILAFVFTMLFR